MRLLQRDPAALVANFCTGRGTTILDLARLIVDLARSPVPIRHAPARIGDIRHSIGLSTRAAAALGIEAQIRLVKGLENTWFSLAGSRPQR
jgi:UDP-glucose 4-epimerase